MPSCRCFARRVNLISEKTRPAIDVTPFQRVVRMPPPLLQRAGRAPENGSCLQRRQIRAPGQSIDIERRGRRHATVLATALRGPGRFRAIWRPNASTRVLSSLPSMSPTELRPAWVIGSQILPAKKKSRVPVRLLDAVAYESDERCEVSLTLPGQMKGGRHQALHIRQPRARHGAFCAPRCPWQVAQFAPTSVRLLQVRIGPPGIAKTIQ